MISACVRAHKIWPGDKSLNLRKSEVLRIPVYFNKF